jgi:tryptophan halogenase
MMSSNVREIVIAGADAAAGSVAVATAVSLQGSGIGITLLLPPNPGSPRSVEVFRGGPQGFHVKLGIEESTLCQQTSAVHGMGTRYRGLFESAEVVFVPLGTHGMTLRLVDFHHYVAKLRAEGDVQDFNGWSIAAAAAKTGRFDPAQTGVEPALRLFEYDLYVDHDSYLAAMLKHASSLGVKIVRQPPVNVELNAAGMLESVTLADDSVLHGDFFIDCSQDRSLIRHVTADDEFQDWSSWLSCDRLVSLPAKPQTTPNLFVSIEADDSGWLSQLSTHGKTAGAFVYDSAEIDDTEAVEKLATWLPSADTDNAQVANFRPGRYAKHWEKNCVAIEPATAVVAPMEVSPLKLAHGSILRLLAMLPRRKDSPMLAAEFNRMTNAEIDSTRDYQLLRLALADRQTGPFWQRMQQTQWPDSLQQRIDLFRSRGRFTRQDNEFFTKSNWISSFINLGFWPASYDPLADMVDEQQMRADLVRFKKIVQSGT